MRIAAAAPAPSSGGRDAAPSEPGGAHGQPSDIGWIRYEDGCQRSLPVDLVTLRSEPRWPGIHLEETRSRPGELPEGHLSVHMVVLNLGREVRTETSWRGEATGTLEVTIPPSGVTIIPAGVRFATRWLDPVQNVVVAISPGTLTPHDGRAGLTELRPQIAVEDAFVEHVVLALRELARARCDDPLCAEAIGAALAAHLLTRYGRQRARHVGARGGFSPAAFRRIAEHVEERLAEPLTLRDLAALAGLSVYQFSRMFKATAGASPHHYVLARRLERARTLLEETSLAVGDIAVQCGFAHPSHLTSTFQRVYATTPSRHREACARR